MKSLTVHFKPKNIPMARQNFLAVKPTPGERIHNFVTSLSTLPAHCEYQEEKDNMTREQVLIHIKDKNLRAKFFCIDNLTLTKLLVIASQYHDKEALTLVREKQINRLHAEESAESVTKLATWQELVTIHIIKFVSPVAKSAIFLFVVDTPRVAPFTKRDPSHIAKSRIKSELSPIKAIVMNNKMIASMHLQLPLVKNLRH